MDIDNLMSPEKKILELIIRWVEYFVWVEWINCLNQSSTHIPVQLQDALLWKTTSSLDIYSDPDWTNAAE